VHALEIEVAVGRREAIRVRAAQRDDDVPARHALLVEDAVRHRALEPRQHGVSVT
jgi:hypothetical protein